jgi:hypothetical protein
VLKSGRHFGDEALPRLGLLSLFDSCADVSPRSKNFSAENLLSLLIQFFAELNDSDSKLVRFVFNGAVSHIDLLDIES